MVQQSGWQCPKCGRVFDKEPLHHFCDKGATTIEEYIHSQEEAVQPPLLEIYVALKEVLPNAKEKISYRMPTFWQGRNLIHFAPFAKWIGLFPGGEVTTIFADRLTDYKTTKGGIRLPYNQELPIELIKEIAKWCEERYAK